MHFIQTTVYVQILEYPPVYFLLHDIRPEHQPCLVTEVHSTGRPCAINDRGKYLPVQCQAPDTLLLGEYEGWLALHSLAPGVVRWFLLIAQHTVTLVTSYSVNTDLGTNTRGQALINI